MLGCAQLRWPLPRAPVLFELVAHPSLDCETHLRACVRVWLRPCFFACLSPCSLEPFFGGARTTKGTVACHGIHVARVNAFCCFLLATSTAMTCLPALICIQLPSLLPSGLPQAPTSRPPTALADRASKRCCAASRRQGPAAEGGVGRSSCSRCMGAAAKRMRRFCSD